MFSSTSSGNVIYVNHFKEDISIIYKLLTKQKKLKLIIEQCPFTAIKFLNDKNLDEIGFQVKLIIRNEIMIYTETVNNGLNSFSHQIISIDHELIENPFILNYSFLPNTNDNSTIVLVESNRKIYNKKNEKILKIFFDDICKSMKEYNKNYCSEQIIFDSNVICRPFDTIKKNINVFVEILSKFYIDKNNKKNIVNKNNENNNINDTFYISKEIQILDEELDIYFQSKNNKDKIRLSIISLSEISCYVQLMEKFEYVSNGKIIIKISKLNQKLLKLIKEHFEHCFSL